MPSGFDFGKREVKKHQVTPESYDDTVDNSPHRSTEHVDAAHSHLQDSNDHKPRYLDIIESVFDVLAYSRKLQLCVHVLRIGAQNDVSLTQSIKTLCENL